MNLQSKIDIFGRCGN